MTERHVERASIDELYNAKDKRYPQDASPTSTGRDLKEEQTRNPNSDQILIEVNKEFNDDAKFTVVKRINQNVAQRNYKLLEKALATQESNGSDPSNNPKQLHEG